MTTNADYDRNKQVNNPQYDEYGQNMVYRAVLRKKKTDAALFSRCWSFPASYLAYGRMLDGSWDGPVLVACLLANEWDERDTLLAALPPMPKPQQKLR
jgi:hypothetical protein